MRTTKEQTTPPARAPKSKELNQPKIIQVKQPKRNCTCGACDPPKPMLPVGMRRIKVQQKYIAKVTSSIRSSTWFPVIILTGEWLRKSGFEYQNHVIVIEKKGQLIINLDTA